MPARKKRRGKFGTVSPEQPIFTHDCDNCVFLGHYHDTRFSLSSDRSVFDLYWCEQAGVGVPPTVIARHGDDGPDYYSGYGMGIPPLWAAEERAERMLTFD